MELDSESEDVEGAVVNLEVPAQGVKIPTSMNSLSIGATADCQPARSTSVKFEIGPLISYTVHQNRTDLRQAEPPRQETVEKPFPTLSFPFFDSSKLQPIDLSIPLPVTRLTMSVTSQESQYVNISLTSRNDQAMPSMEGPSGSRPMVPVSVCRNNLRMARRQAMNKIGIVSWSDEKKLLAAVRNNDVCTVIRLLEDGVSPNVSDSKKRTPLHIAASQGLDHIVSSLTAMRADPNKIDVLGNSPLHLAVCRGDTRIVRILIGSGANIHLKDNIGRTPLDIVKSRLNMLRRDRSISTDKLIGECQMICDVLKIHAAKLPYCKSNQVDVLCDMMANVSTREQANEFADAVMNQMSGLSLEHKGKWSYIL